MYGWMEACVLYGYGVRLRFSCFLWINPYLASAEGIV
jgi:hypothetical protein